MHKVRAILPKVLNHKKRGKLFAYIGLGAIGLILLIQLLYPSDRLLPFTKVDGITLGPITKQSATETLNTAYQQKHIAIHMGIDSKPFTSPTLADLNVTVDNTQRIREMNYPWYLRLVPTSLLWAGLKTSAVPAPQYGAKFEQFIDSTLMPECKKAPIDASLRFSDGSLQVVPAQPGGQCERDDVVATLKKVRPALPSPTIARVAQKSLAPTISDNDAKNYSDQLTKRIGVGIPILVDGATIALPANEVFSWLDFATKDAALTTTVNMDRAGAYLANTVAAKVAIKPGVSYITTVDFTETSRVNGASGRALNVGGTVSSIQSFIRAESNTAAVSTIGVPPTEQYTRSYSPSDAGISALITNYAKDHPGVYGVSFIELDGKKRRANYNGDKKFTTASTYKLLVAYSILKRVDAGSKSWDSVSACFNKMISLSDNPCSEAFLKDVGLRTVTNEVNDIGLKNSNFIENGGPFTTANDLALLLGMLESGQNFSTAGRIRLLDAMKANVYRKGIPAGATGTVANKVGFMNNLLHDAAVVYSPNGTYVLIIMTEGSSWATIADFAKQIDTLRAQS
ncbi:MAG: serine hydrolase [Candidatus Saccharimonas sp.]